MRHSPVRAARARLAACAARRSGSPSAAAGSLDDGTASGDPVQPAAASASAAAATVRLAVHPRRHLPVAHRAARAHRASTSSTRSTRPSRRRAPTSGTRPGNKYFSFTFQAYDLARDLRDPFKTKRKVYLEPRSQVTSATTTSDGGADPGAVHARRLGAQGRTFDPEPLTTKYGMLITSPKGAFELRNQAIGEVSADTVGVDARPSTRRSAIADARPARHTFTERHGHPGRADRDLRLRHPDRGAQIPVNAN